MKILSKAFKSIFALRLSILSFILFSSVIFYVGCSTPIKLDSNWRDREIIIDGKNTDWLGAMYYFEDENISVGLLNDEGFMYICMIAEDPLIRAQVMRQGFTVWFDPKGGKEKTFGIRFPIGRQEIGMAWGMREGELDQERFREAFKESISELEILGPGKDRQKRMEVKDAKGINISVEVSSGMIIYELKVPLNRSEENPYAVGANAGNTIGIGFETPKLDMSGMRERMGGRRPGGGGIPGGGGRGGTGGMGMRGGRRPQMPRDLKVWAIVQLASEGKSIQ